MSGAETAGPSATESALAARTEQLYAQVQASLAEAQALLEREQRRLADLLSAPPPSGPGVEPPPGIQPLVSPSLAGGLEAIDRTMRSTMDYLTKHAHRPQVPDHLLRLPAATPEAMTP